MTRALKGRTLTVRLTEEQHKRLHAATVLGPYHLSVTEIVARGIELAAREIEAQWSTEE